MNATELKVIHMALDSLESNPLFKGMWKYVIYEGKDIEISLYARDRTLKFKTLTRQEIRSRHLPFILEQAKSKQPFMLIAGKIYPDVKEALRQNNITYLEANGNISLQLEDLFVWVDSNKPVTIKNGRNNRAFTKTGLKVLFHFLMNENFLNIPYREIADLTGTSLGNVTNVMNALKETGHLFERGTEGYKLKNKKQLLDRWVAAYEQVLKPILEVGTFRFINEQDHQNWRRVPLENRKSLWGAEAGVHLLTGQLRPHDLVIYTNESRNDIINQYRLVRDNEGYIKVYQKFWNYDDFRSNIAPPILIYADLLNVGDGNALEAAKRVYEDYLKDKIEDKASAFNKAS
jgi:hypothetical protein